MMQFEAGETGNEEKNAHNFGICRNDCFGAVCLRRMECCTF